MAGHVTAKWLKENFVDKGRDPGDVWRVLSTDPNMMWDGDALLMVMGSRYMNSSAPAWRAAYYALTGKRTPEYMGALPANNITPEQFDWALKQAEDLGLPGQSPRVAKEIPDSKGFVSMSHYAAGLLFASVVPLSEPVLQNAIIRARERGSTTSTQGLAERLASGQFTAEQRRQVTKGVGWTQLLGQRGAWPHRYRNDVPPTLSPEEAQEAWDEIRERARNTPTEGDELKREEPVGAIQTLLNSSSQTIPKQAYEELFTGNHPVFALNKGEYTKDLKLEAVRNTPYPEHHKALLDEERKFQDQYAEENQARAGRHGRWEIEQLLMHNRFIKPEFLNDVFEVLPEIIPSLARGRVSQVPGLAEKLHKYAVDQRDQEMAHDLIRNDISTPNQVAYLVERFPSLRNKLDELGLEWSYPDLFAEHRVAVAFGTNKMRQARDHILSKGKTELSPKEMPPGNWSVARLPNGNISADLLQKVIDSAPRIKYNVTHDKWEGAQRHSDDDSKVFQLNLTADQMKQLDDAGVYGKFRKMHEASRQSGHPLGPTGIGWVRWTGGKKDGGIFMDEVQSDFGQSFIRQAAREARESGYEPEVAEEKAREMFGDESDYDKIKAIVFGGKHPSEVLQEAFHEWLRTPHQPAAVEVMDAAEKCKGCGEAAVGECHCGHEHQPKPVDYRGLPIHIWQAESKATISLGLPDETLPGHFYVGYRDQPSKKMGMKPGLYGELKTQKNARHQAKVNHEGPKYVRGCESCGEQVELGIGREQLPTCPSCGTKQKTTEDFAKVGHNIELRPAKATWKDEVRKNEDQREMRPNHTFQEHALPGSLAAEGYKLNIAHMPGVAIGTVHRGGKALGHVQLVDWEPKEEWFDGGPHRAGLREAVLRVLEGHAKGEQEPDGWSHPLPGPRLLAKAEGPSTLRPESPPGFHQTPEGHHITAPHPTYAHASAAKPKGMEAPGGKNVWVRPHHEPSNANRTLMVQFSSDLLQSNRQKDSSDAYYDALYSKRQGYHRPADWWEVPQWQAHLAHSMSNADHYTVRDPAEAVEFLKHAGYKNVAFSSLDVTAPFIKDLAAALPNQHFAVGGYTDMGMYAKHPNVSVHPSVQHFVESEGGEYKPGYDYRHFAGVKVIPRLTLSNGCRHNCTFCCVPKQVIEKPMDEVNQQADAFGKHLDSELVYLNDKTFGQAPNHAELPNLYRRIKAQNPNFKGFVIQTTAAAMKRFTPQFLRDSGIQHVELGIESFNDPILRAHKKPANEAIIEEAAQKIRDAGASLIPNIMTGLPGENRETYGRTMDWLKKNRDIISHVNAYNLALYEESELGKKLQAVNAADRDENQQVKSWMADPQVHKDFSDELFRFANGQLDQPVGHVTPEMLGLTQPMAKAEVDPNMKMVGLLSTKGGNAHREMGDLVPSVVNAEYPVSTPHAPTPDPTAYQVYESPMGYHLLTPKGNEQWFDSAAKRDQYLAWHQQLSGTKAAVRDLGLRKTEGPRQDAIVGAAFRHPRTGEVIHAGPFHDWNILSARGVTEADLLMYESGFVDAAGRFLTRKQARRATGLDFAHDLIPEGSEVEQEAMARQGEQVVAPKSSFKKTEDPHPPMATSVLVHDEHGRVLWGRRRKDGKWTLPGGHLEPGEDPAMGALRELFEEAGIAPESIYHFSTANMSSGLPVFLFHAQVSDQQPHAQFDPDHEVVEWRWVDCLMGCPSDIRNNLAHPRNVILEHMGW